MTEISFQFEQLIVYQKAITFSSAVYSITTSWPKEHLFGITDQFRRASLSISLNIAEGYSRTRKEFQHYLLISRGSCYECIPIISMAKILGLLSEEHSQRYYNDLKELAKMLSALRTTLSSKP